MYFELIVWFHIEMYDRLPMTLLLSLNIFELIVVKEGEGEGDCISELKMKDYARYMIGRSTLEYIVQTYFEHIINFLYLVFCWMHK